MGKIRDITMVDSMGTVLWDPYVVTSGGKTSILLHLVLPDPLFYSNQYYYFLNDMDPLTFHQITVKCVHFSNEYLSTHRLVPIGLNGSFQLGSLIDCYTQRTWTFIWWVAHRWAYFWLKFCYFSKLFGSGLASIWELFMP